MKAKATAAVFDAEKVRRKNKRALQKLLKVNAELENAKDLRSHFQNRKRLERDEREFFKECERRLFKLNLESDIWIDEREKVAKLCKRRQLLFGVMVKTNEQLLEEPVMKSLNRAAQQQQERLTFLNKELRKNIGVLSRQLVHQTRLFDEFTEMEKESKEIIELQDSYFRELRQKLKTYDLVTVKEKVAAEQEELKEAVEKNKKLVEMIKMLRHQATNVPMLKYQFLCAVDEKRRLTALNTELDRVILVLTDRLLDQVCWEDAYKDMETKLRDLEQTENDHVKKIEGLKPKTKLGTKALLSSFSKDKKNKKVTSRMGYFKTKINNLLKEYKAFQPEIEKFLGDLKPPFETVISRTTSAENLNSPGNTVTIRKPETFSESSSSDAYQEHVSTDESTDSNQKYPQPTSEPDHLENKSIDSSQKRDSFHLTTEDTSESDTDDSTDACCRRDSFYPTEDDMFENLADRHKIRNKQLKKTLRSKIRHSKSGAESEDS